MRVLVLTDTYPPAATGGYERSCENVVTRWRRAGDDVLVLTTVAEAPAHTGVVRRLTSDDGSAINLILSGFRPDVVSVWNVARVPQRQLLAPVAAAGIPLVIVACDGWLADADPSIPAAAASSRIAFVSDDLRRGVPLPAWAPQRTSIVPSGIDTDVFRPREEAARPWRNRLLYVGRLARVKGVTDAVDALAHLPDEITLRIVAADHPDRWHALSGYVAARGLGPRITTRTTDRQGLVEEYRDADVVLFPSRWREPFGLVPLEAMACGTPVIGTGTGGSSSYLVDAENALVVPPEDPGALAAAVQKLARDGTLRRVLTANGLQTCRHYTIDRTAARLSELNRRAVADR